MAIWLKFKAWIIAVLAAISAVIGIYLYGRKSGAAKEIQRQREVDLDSARKVEDAADRARRADGDNIDPIERLKKYKSLRDL